MAPTTDRTDIADAAGALLRDLAGPAAVLRPAQLEAIEAVVCDRRRALVVQRTGFGKSAVYFIATRLLRDAGAGPTLVVSPLLALMRDQVAAAARMGVRSATINSTNVDDWREIEDQLAAGELDLLCISPERLNHFRFARDILPRLAAGLGLLVVDEAHCISDWGHDFRPDYRRIRDAIANLDPATPVIATTATANDRVTTDVAEQLGDDVLVLRGTLDRESLSLGVVQLDSSAQRLAWIAQRIGQVDGTGIVYCLTVEQTTQVAAFLQQQGIDAAAYSGHTPVEDRVPLEERFKGNEVKVLVATSALGMGVDKADVAFVIHLGAPPSPIAYYQQVGRAGRALARAEAWLLPSPEDRAIWDYFTSVGLPPEPLVQRVLAELGEVPVSVPALERAVDLRRTRLETLLKILDVDGAIERTSEGWLRTGRPWSYDRERVERIQAARRHEAEEMLAYASSTTCLMRRLRLALDDAEAADCGRCGVCRGSADPVQLDPDVVRAAVEFLRGVDVVVEPRRQWARAVRSGPSGTRARGRFPRARSRSARSRSTWRAVSSSRSSGWRFRAASSWRWARSVRRAANAWWRGRSRATSTSTPSRAARSRWSGRRVRGGPACSPRSTAPGGSRSPRPPSGSTPGRCRSSIGSPRPSGRGHPDGARG